MNDHAQDPGVNEVDIEEVNVASAESKDASAAGTEVTRALLADLVRFRKKRKIGQEPIAKAIGVTQSRVSQLENSKGTMTLEAFLLYAQAIGAEVLVVPAKDRKKK